MKSSADFAGRRASKFAIRQVKTIQWPPLGRSRPALPESGARVADTCASAEDFAQCWAPVRARETVGDHQRSAGSSARRCQYRRERATSSLSAELMAFWTARPRSAPGHGRDHQLISIQSPRERGSPRSAPGSRSIAFVAVRRDAGSSRIRVRYGASVTRPQARYRRR